MAGLLAGKAERFVAEGACVFSFLAEGGPSSTPRSRRSVVWSITMASSSVLIVSGPQRLRLVSATHCVAIPGLDGLAGRGADLKAVYDTLGGLLSPGRIAQALEIANAPAFLASDQAGDVKAASFQVDGGLAQAGAIKR